METVAAQVVDVNDLQARRISAAENLQREDLSAIEKIEAIVKIVDAELIEDKEYLSMGDNPADRVKTLLGKLHSIENSKYRGSQVSGKGKSLLRKFAQQVAKIFQNLPKPLEWRSFTTMTFQFDGLLRRGPGGVDPAQSICIDDYIGLLKRAGWEITHIIDAPLSTQRFQPRMVSRMQKNRTLGSFGVH